MTRHECQHIQRGELPAITRLTHVMVPGAPSVGDDLETETLLCAVCSGVVVSVLVHIERCALTDADADADAHSMGLPFGRYRYEDPE